MKKIYHSSESWSSYVTFRGSRCEGSEDNQGYREALHSDKGVSFPRRQINPVYVTNSTTLKYVRQTLKEMKGEIDKSTIVREFNSLWLVIEGTDSLEISKETDDLNSTINQNWPNWHL